MSRTHAKTSDDYLVRIYKGTTHLRLFLFLSIGVVLYGSVGVPSLWFCVAGGITFIALLLSFFTKRNLLFSISLAVFLVSFGGLWSAAPLSPFAKQRMSWGDARQCVSTSYSIEILTPQKVVGNHLACDAYITSVSPVETEHAPSLPQSYKIRLNTDTSLHFRVGQNFTARLNVYMPRYRGGEFNYPLYLYRNGYSGVAWLNDAKVSLCGEVQDSAFALTGRYANCLRPRAMPWAMCSLPFQGAFIEGRSSIVADIRRWIVECYSAMGITGDNLQILSAITFGNRPTDETISHNFRDAGVAHILVVSGMHVGFLFLLISLLYKRRKRWWVIVCGVVLLWLYALLVGMTPSVVRATLMFTIMLLMKLSGGSYSSLNALSIAAIILLIANPMVIYNVSFQMSFLAVLSIILFYPAIPAIGFNKVSFRRSTLRLYPSLARFVEVLLKAGAKIVTVLYDAARLSIAAQLLLIPVVLYYFHTFPTYFLLTNVAVTLLTPVIFIGGMFTLIPLIGKLFAPLVNLAITVDYSMVRFIASLPYSILHCEINFPITIVLILTILALANALRSKFSFASLAFLLGMIPVCCLVSLTIV